MASNYSQTAISQLDDLLKEYLLFRGFTQTIRILDTEKKNDKLKGYQVCNLCISLFLSFASKDSVNKGLFSYFQDI